jgi:hypothetical protein
MAFRIPHWLIAACGYMLLSPSMSAIGESERVVEPDHLISDGAVRMVDMHCLSCCQTPCCKFLQRQQRMSENMSYNGFASVLGALVGARLQLYRGAFRLGCPLE